MIEWAKRLLIAATAIWAGMNIMNVWLYANLHHMSFHDLPFDLLFSSGFMGCGPLIIAFGVAASPWPSKRSNGN